MTVERLGVPSIGIMTTNFISAAELMARTLGAEGYPFAIIEHPISSADDATLAAKAKKAIDSGLQILTGEVDRPV